MKPPRLSALLLALLLLVQPVSALADVQVVLNQTPVQFDVPPRNENGRLLVPVRTIFEALGANITWDGTKRTVDAVAPDGTDVFLKIGSAVALVNGQVVNLDVGPKIVDGRTLVPLRFVSEALGADVGWNSDTQTVTINRAPFGQGATPAQPSTEAVAQKAVSATVYITATASKTGERLVGSGFFLNAKGLVVTNDHVIAGADKITVKTNDQLVYTAKVLTSDGIRDVAILETNATGYPYLPLAPNAALAPGQRVLTVGNPLGLDWSVSDGMISSSDRELFGLPWVQHTAPISQGSSGGPLLLESTGQVIGMNTMMAVASGAQNLNFAVPVESILATLNGDDPPAGAGVPVAKTQPTSPPAPTTPTSPAPQPATPPPPPAPTYVTPDDTLAAVHWIRNDLMPAADVPPVPTATKNADIAAYLSFLQADFLPRMKICMAKVPDEALLKNKQYVDAGKVTQDASNCFYALRDRMLMKRAPDGWGMVNYNYANAMESLMQAVMNLNTAVYYAGSNGSVYTIDNSLLSLQNNVDNAKRYLKLAADGWRAKLPLP